MAAKTRAKKAKMPARAKQKISKIKPKPAKMKAVKKAAKPKKISKIKLARPKLTEAKSPAQAMRAAVEKALGKAEPGETKPIPKKILKAKKVKGKTLGELKKQIAKQREPIKAALEKAKFVKRVLKPGHVWTNVSGLDELLVDGVPDSASVLIAGGPGSGKTILCLQMAYEAAKRGEKALYLSFEESEQRLMSHMKNFGWKDVDELIKKGMLKIYRVFPLEIKRSVDALLAKAKGELMIDVPPIVFPDNFQPDKLVIDSLTAIAATFVGTDETYRIYIEQLFRFLEKIHATTFLITETETLPVGRYSTSGVEEFLADGVIVLYNLRKGSVRESAIEVLKMRGVNHKKRIVAMRVTEKGVEVFPDQEVFGEFA